MSNSGTTVRWAAPSILVGGLLYALYGILNRLLAATLMGYFLSNFLGAALLAVGVEGLHNYLREQRVPLGRGKLPRPHWIAHGIMDASAL